MAIELAMCRFESRSHDQGADDLCGEKLGGKIVPGQNSRKAVEGFGRRCGYDGRITDCS